MAKTVKITTNNHISVLDVLWNVEAQGEMIGADIHGCTIAGDVLFGIQRGPEILPPDDAEEMKYFLMRQFPGLSEAEGVS